MTILRGHPDPAFDLQAAALISTILAETDLSYYVLPDTVELMLARLGKEEELRALDPCGDDSALLTLWQETVDDLGISWSGSAALSAVRDFQASRQRLLDKLRATYSR